MATKLPLSATLDEPIENRMADAMVDIMRTNMPDPLTVYRPGDMLWGDIWRQMQSTSQRILSGGK